MHFCWFSCMLRDRTCERMNIYIDSVKSKYLSVSQQIEKIVYFPNNAVTCEQPYRAFVRNLSIRWNVAINNSKFSIEHCTLFERDTKISIK